MLTCDCLRPSFGADWGDYISLAERLREKAHDDGSDLILVDTGDRIEGSGLYDASEPKGKYTLKIVSEQDIDVLCTGNHELYHNRSANNEYQATVPNSKGNYLASNLDILDPETGERRPMAQRYRKFTTQNQGIRIMAFGFLFDFTMNSNNTFVQKVENTVQEEWFKKAIQDREIDLFLVAGHASLRSPEFTRLFRAIRSQNWDTPIHFFGGHTHIRDYARYDSNAFAMESGRYMETIGFASIDGLAAGRKSTTLANAIPRSHNARYPRALTASPKFGRRYIDNNLFSFHRHTGLNSSTFPTPHGLNVSRQIAEDRKALNLDRRYGCAPHDYWTNRRPFPSNDSIFTWLQDEVLTTMVEDKARAEVPRLVLTNSGALRFDMFEGAFTVDTMYSVSPFTSGFRYIKDVPTAMATRLKAILNQEVPQLWDELDSLASEAPVSVSTIAREGVQAYELSSNEEHRSLSQFGMQIPLVDDNNNGDDGKKPREDLLPGYTTTDDAGSDGDDTIHAPIRFYKVPNCLESRIGFPQQQQQRSSSSREDATDAGDDNDYDEDPQTVDLVYVDFIERYILFALKFLGTDYEEADTAVYMEGQSLTDVIGQWVQRNWKC